ncbi:MAG: CCA tRNA nucleotidyltransferase [Acidimicrobiales bacterium]
MNLVAPASSGAYASIASAVAPVATDFVAAGFQLFLVGGVVRDLLLDRHGAGDDIDATTDARPADIKRLLAPHASALWTQGERFGTIGATVAGKALEITTHRAESYDATSRKPEVAFGDDLRTDLSRRDFTVNAIAIDAASGSLHDPFDGRRDLERRRLATPLDPHVSFSDDPLRMLRAARFIPRFDLDVDPALRAAVEEMAPRLDIVSVERCHDELERLLALPDPAAGLDFLVSTGLIPHLLPGFEPEGNEHCIAVAAAPSLAPRARRAALVMSDDLADERLAHLRYSAVEHRATLAIIRSLDALAGDEGRVVDATLRHLVDTAGDDARDAIDLAGRLGLVDAPATIARLDELWALGDLADLEPPVSGGDLIAELGLEPGPAVGDLVRRLRRHRLDAGPFDRAEAIRLAAGWLDDGPTEPSPGAHRR